MILCTLVSATLTNTLYGDNGVRTRHDVSKASPWSPLLPTVIAIRWLPLANRAENEGFSVASVRKSEL